MGLRDADDTLPGSWGGGGCRDPERSLSQARAGLNSSLSCSWKPVALSVIRLLRTSVLSGCVSIRVEECWPG